MNAFTIVIIVCCIGFVFVAAVDGSLFIRIIFDSHVVSLWAGVAYGCTSQ